MLAAIYVRISSDREGREVGVDRQEADCHALAARLGYEVVATFRENDTGASTKSRKPRPLYAELVDGARAGRWGAIVAYSSSRLTRRPRESEDLIQLFEAHGTQFAYAVSSRFDLSTADGRMQARIAASIDAGEAERTAERVARAKADAAAKGEWRGGPRPFGYEADGVSVRPKEAGALLDAARGLLAGRSLNALAREMTAAGHRTARGAEINGVNLRRILRRARNAGLLERQGTVVGEAKWPAIIPEDVWRAVGSLLDDPSRRTTTGPERKWLGSGLYRCGVCGGPLRATQERSGSLSYRCPDSHVSRDAAALDGHVRQVIGGVLDRDAADLLAVEEDEGRTDELLTEAATLRERLRTFEGDYADGTITGTQLAAASARVEAALERVEGDLTALRAPDALGGVLTAEKPSEAFLGSKLDVQRAIVDVLAVVTVNRGRRGRPAGWEPGQPYADLDSVAFDWR